MWALFAVETLPPPSYTLLEVFGGGDGGSPQIPATF